MSILEMKIYCLLISINGIIGAVRGFVHPLNESIFEKFGRSIMYWVVFAAFGAAASAMIMFAYASARFVVS